MRDQTLLTLFIFLIASRGNFLDRPIPGVEGYAFHSPTQRSVSPLQSRRHSSQLIFTHQPTFLRAQDATSESSHNSVQKNCVQKFHGIFKRKRAQCASQIIRIWLKSRRSILTVCAVFLFWFGAAGTHTPVSHGSSSSVATEVVSQSSRISSALDQTVNKYVKGHMFDDDAYDPVESIYREAMDDRIKGTYPKDLKETTSSVLGQNVIKAGKKSSSRGFTGVLSKAMFFLKRQGLSEMQAIGLIACASLFGAPGLFFTIAMQVANQNKRSVTNMMTKRYGETYSTDASEKKEDDVEIPDDDDDDDDYDDDDDDE